jgi:cellobiose phosphorylase
VTLHHQTNATLATALRRAGREALAAELEGALPGIRDDFQRHLVVDGVIAGFAEFDADGTVRHVIHPTDAETGVHYSALPMIHAILADLLTREQVDHHLSVIRQHLLAPDGARLFDRPFPYRGGTQRQFQRAESSSFFGREIGIMYTHAHLRYAEAMAHLGDAEAFYIALLRANPVGLAGGAVPNARLRQANCYTSSSDADFRDRYEACAHYERVRDGTVAVEGGWRVYSSGAGIGYRLIRERLLGFRIRRATLGLDPVLPRALDGLRATVEIAGHRLSVTYRVGAKGHGPKSLALNGAPLAFEREPNPWRTGGAVVSMPVLRERLRDGENELMMELE